MGAAGHKQLDAAAQRRLRNAKDLCGSPETTSLRREDSVFQVAQVEGYIRHYLFFPILSNDPRPRPSMRGDQAALSATSAN